MAKPECLQSELEKLCECAICCERLTNPRTLACDHSFCKDCLEEMVMFKPRGSPYIVCPNRCGEQCLPLGTTVSKLGASLYLKQLLDLLCKSLDATGPCCNYNECQRPISVYCTACKIFYCYECYNHKVPCKEKHEIKNVKFSKRRNTIEPFCVKHDCSAIYNCQTCSVKYLCQYCKQYNHVDHRVCKLSVETIWKPYKTQRKALERYNELFEDLNGFVSCLWKNVEVTEANFTRYLERRKMELVLQFVDQLLAAESSIRQQYETRVQNFSEDIFNRKQKLQTLTGKNGKYKHLLDVLEQKSLVELLFDERLSLDIETLIKDNQNTYKAVSHLDEFKIYVSPNKEFSLERPFGHVNFSKDILKDEEVMKKLQVLNPVSESKKEKYEILREKNLDALKEKLKSLLSADVFTKNDDNDLNIPQSFAKPQSDSSPHVPKRKGQKTGGFKMVRCQSEDSAKESQKPTKESRKFSVDCYRFQASGKKSPHQLPKFDQNQQDGGDTHESPPDVPARVPMYSPFIPDHPPPAMASRQTSAVEKGNSRAQQIDTHDYKNHPSNEDTDESHFPGQHDSLPLRKNQLKQKRRPPVLPKPDRVKEMPPQHQQQAGLQITKF